jgi:hypothetical protein
LKRAAGVKELMMKSLLSNAFLIPTITCSVTATATSPSNCDVQQGSTKLLYGNIKVPSAANKNVILTPFTTVSACTPAGCGAVNACGP